MGYLISTKKGCNGEGNSTLKAFGNKGIFGRQFSGQLLQMFPQLCILYLRYLKGPSSLSLDLPSRLFNVFSRFNFYGVHVEKN